MNRLSFFLVLAMVGSIAPMRTLAAVSEEVANTVTSALAGQATPADVITLLTSDPYNLELVEATVSAIEVGGAEYAGAMASAGIAAAANLPEAEAVAAAVRPIIGDDAAIDAAMAQYVKLMDQPFIHHDPTDPTGGGAYNPQAPGGGTRPPITGPRPPVSPAS